MPMTDQFYARSGKARLVAALTLALSASACSTVTDRNDFKVDTTAPALSAPAATAKPLAPTASVTAKAAPHGEKADANIVLRQSLLQHPAVLEAAGKVAASRGGVAVARAAYYPQLTAGVTGGWGDARSSDAAFAVTGEQLITDFGVTDRAVKASNADVEMRFRQFQKAVDDAILEALKAQTDVQLYGEVAKIRAAQLAKMREILKLVAERKDAGATTTPDLLETEKRIQKAEFEHLQAQLRLAQAQTTLMKLSGYREADRLPEMEIKGSCRSDAIGSNDLQIARLDQVKAEYALQGAQKARLPRLALAPVVEQPISGDRMRYGMNVKIGSNLFEGGAIKAREDMAQNNLRAAKAGMENAARNEALLDNDLSRNIQVYGEQAAMLNRQIAILKHARELYRDQYFDLGTRSLKDLLDNEEEYYSAQAQLVEARFERSNNVYKCALVRKELRGRLGLSGSSLHGMALADN